VVSATVRLHDNFHILIECYQEAQQAFYGKLAELAAQHFRNIGLADSEQAGGLHGGGQPGRDPSLRLKNGSVRDDAPIEIASRQNSGWDYFRPSTKYKSANILW
jgi:hypothetical protein